MEYILIYLNFFNFFVIPDKILKKIVIYGDKKVWEKKILRYDLLKKKKRRERFVEKKKRKERERENMWEKRENWLIIILVIFKNLGDKCFKNSFCFS